MVNLLRRGSFYEVRWGPRCGISNSKAFDVSTILNLLCANQFKIFLRIHILGGCFKSKRIKLRNRYNQYLEMHNFIKHNFMFHKMKHILALTQGKSLILKDSVHPAVRIMKNKT